MSGYDVDFDGTLTLLDADGVTGSTGAGSGPIDSAISDGGRFLYSLNSGTNSVSIFRINQPSGELTPVSAVPGLPAGANGLVIR